MDFEIMNISFYMVTVEGKEDKAIKQYKHFQTLKHTDYEESTLKEFLDGELEKIAKPYYCGLWPLFLFYMDA